MSKNYKPAYVNQYNNQSQKQSVSITPLKTATSLLDEMQDGKEYESIIGLGVNNLDLSLEIKRAIHDISVIRQRPVVCYLANVINTSIKASISIESYDDLPFAEMISRVDSNKSELDIILVTPGGRSDQVASFVEKLRPRFDDVQFILPFMCMSAGTMFCLSGNEIIMDSRAYIGPIDPQIPSKNGMYIPAQAIQVLIKDIQERGQKVLDNGAVPNWTDLQILNNIDPKELGNCISASLYSILLVTNYLENYKLKNWNEHKSTGASINVKEKHETAERIAGKLCDHQFWKTHSRGIYRDLAYTECGLQIIHPETIPNLNRAIRRFWALIYWIFERSAITKMFISEEYSILRSDPSITIQSAGRD